VPNTITVYWSSVFNGDFEQSFYIEICQDNGGDCREYGPFLDSPVKYQCGQIRDLQPRNNCGRPVTKCYIFYLWVNGKSIRFYRNLDIRYTCMFEYMTLYRKNSAYGFRALNHINANELTGRIIPSGIYRPSADFYY
jgi:hypothetical protein